LLGRRWRSYQPKDIDVHSTGEWKPERILIAADPASLDGYYGLAGITTETTEKFARSIVRTAGDGVFGRVASVFDVYYLTQPGGGRFTVLVDGKTKAQVNTAASRKRTGFVKVKVKEASHEFEVRTSGGGKVRLFGASVESERGLVYDTLGVNGGFFYTPHRWNEEELQKQIRRRDPRLLVTMYGTNEVGSRVLTRKKYKASVIKTMKKLYGGVADGSCLMLGPPDRNTDSKKEERLDIITGVQREVAMEMGCAFIDLRQMMGGPMSHLRWEETTPPMAQSDGIHLTVKGYMFLGDLIADEILKGFDNFSASFKAESIVQDSENNTLQ
jgi:lysophospholipase L1-like esterase